MLQEEIKDWAAEACLLTKENQFLITADWIMENDLGQILCKWFLNFYQTEEVWIVFRGMSYPNLLK